MSKRYTIECDGPDCARIIVTTAHNEPEADRKAAAVGWHRRFSDDGPPYTGPVLDLCPYCARKVKAVAG